MIQSHPTRLDHYLLSWKKAFLTNVTSFDRSQLRTLFGNTRWHDDALNPYSGSFAAILERFWLFGLLGAFVSMQLHSKTSVYQNKTKSVSIIIARYRSLSTTVWQA